MTLVAAKLVWLAGCIAWFVIRLPHQLRARKAEVERRVWRARETVLLLISFAGLFLVPLFYAVTDEPRAAGYAFSPALAWAGAAVFAAALYLFYRTHRDLGRAWSVTLEVRRGHALVTHGVYARVRHPMYSAFWLWAIAQALLLPNLAAGLAGIVGFGTLFFGRVGREEAMMAERFGADYRAYVTRTKRILPGLY